MLPASGHGVHLPGDEAGVATPPEPDLLVRVGHHLTLQHHTGVQWHRVQHLGLGLTSGRI